MRCNVFKRRQALSFTVSLKQLPTIVKNFITKALEYKAILKFKNNLCIATHFLVMSPCSHDFLLTSLYIYSNKIILIVDYYSSLTYECLVLKIVN